MLAGNKRKWKKTKKRVQIYESNTCRKEKGRNRERERVVGARIGERDRAMQLERESGRDGGEWKIKREGGRRWMIGGTSGTGRDHGADD